MHLRLATNRPKLLASPKAEMLPFVWIKLSFGRCRAPLPHANCISLPLILSPVCLALHSGQIHQGSVLRPSCERGKAIGEGILGLTPRPRVSCHLRCSQNHLSIRSKAGLLQPLRRARRKRALRLASWQTHQRAFSPSTTELWWCVVSTMLHAKRCERPALEDSCS
jgi:hypothetical protein